MRDLDPRSYMGRKRSWLLLVTAVVLALSICIGEVVTLPTDPGSNQWPTFPRRNIAALARAGYLKNAALNLKRSISTLAKNGQLPTLRSPYDDSDKHEQDEDGAQEKRNVASIARLRSFAALKRNIQALARDGYRAGRGQYNQPNDKRNIAALARNGLMIHKKDDANGDEYYYPFYQNSIPPLSELDEPIDFNELYDYQQSVNPDMFPPLSQVFKRDIPDFSPQAEYTDHGRDIENSWYLKRRSGGLPVHGLIRPMYVNAPNTRNKRYILTLPDDIDNNDIHDTDAENQANENEDKRSVDEETYDKFEKRHIGSLARLGLLPSFRFSGGRYSRSGRARLLWPSQELYRKHTADENFGIRQYFTGPEAESAVDPDDTDVPPAAVPANSHPTGRILNRVNDVPTVQPLPSPPLPPTNTQDPLARNRWQSTKETPKFYYFRSLKIPYQQSAKRYLLIPTVDNILLRKSYRNSSLPSRRKNQ